MRVVPVEPAVGKGKGVAPYNQVLESVKKEEVFAVQDCICRKEKDIMGDKCDYPRDLCFTFGDFGQYLIQIQSPHFRLSPFPCPSSFRDPFLLPSA
jgi:hypothetical protein